MTILKRLGSATPHVVPRPHSFHAADGSYELGAAATVSHSLELAGIARRLAGRLSVSTGLAFTTRHQFDGTGIELRLDPTLASGSHRISITETGVAMTGGSPAAVHAATETLLQLLPPEVYRDAHVTREGWILPGLEIFDTPAHEWRALLLDVARHFIPKREILRIIDLMSMHKLNVLQLHLTDDQGWRMEIKRYPLLTEEGSWRAESTVGVSEDTDGVPHGGFYTQTDLREIVHYAADRFITVVPEVDVPAHTQAAIAAYPSLGLASPPPKPLARWGNPDQILNAEDSTLEFLHGVFDEVLDVFPSVVIAIGGDEVPFALWEQDERTGQRMRELGLREPRELHQWFIERVCSYLRERGRRVIGWDEIVDSGAPADALVASWRGDDHAIDAARRGHQVVSCPTHTTYFDYRQSEDLDEPTPVGTVTTLSDVYRFSPVPVGMPAELRHLVIGGQANVWTEHMPSARYREYMIFPRLCAFADAVWRSSPPEPEVFATSMTAHLERLAALDVGFRPVGEASFADRLSRRSLTR